MTEIIKNPERGLIRPGVTIRELIQERDYKGDSLVPFVETLLKEWHLQVLPKVRQEMRKPLPEFKGKESISGIKKNIFLSGANVEILGIRHGLGFITSNSEYNRAVRAHVQETANEREWVGEEGLAQQFRIQDSVAEIKDMTAYIAAESKKQTGSNNALNVLSLSVKEPVKVVLTLTFRKNGELASLIKSLLGFRLLRRAEYYLLTQKIMEMANLPEPLNMEAGLVLANGDNDQGNMAIDRSHIQALSLLNHITMSQKTNKAMNFGLICGGIHKSQVDYFLTHPAYNPHLSLAEARKLLRK